MVTKPIFDPNPPVENTIEGEGTAATPSSLAVFMKTFRNFHTVCYEKILLYWPVVRHRTRSVLAKVGLESVSTVCMALIEHRTRVRAKK